MTVFNIVVIVTHIILIRCDNSDKNTEDSRKFIYCNRYIKSQKVIVLTEVSSFDFLLRTHKVDIRCVPK